MAKCPECGSENENGAKFCCECGTLIPQTKECPTCHAVLQANTKFCPECGYNFVKNASQDSSGIMGDKNVIAGDVTNTITTHNYINQDETKKVVHCHVCHRPLVITEARKCNSCGDYVCEEHYNFTAGMCKTCAESQYCEKCAEMLADDDRIDLNELKQLSALAEKLGIDKERRLDLDQKVKTKNRIQKRGDKLIDIELTQYNKAKDILFEKGDGVSALTYIEDLYKAHPTNEDVLSLYLTALGLVDEERVMKFINTLSADIMRVYLLQFDIELKKGNLLGAGNILEEVKERWADDMLVKCRDIELKCISAIKFDSPNYLADAQDLYTSLSKTSDKLENSWQVYVKHLVLQSLGEDIPDITPEYCKENNLYYAITSGRFQGFEIFSVRKFCKNYVANRNFQSGNIPPVSKSQYSILLSSAKKDNPEAALIVGDCLSAFTGEDVEADVNSAFKFYEKAANTNLSDAQYMLGVCYESGVGCKKDADESKYWYTRSELKDNISLTSLTSEMIAENPKYLIICEHLAKKGDAFFQFTLGRCYRFGHGVPNDGKKAIEWYTKSAEQGHAMAQNNLGVCYWRGLGVSKDVVKAFELYSKAADQGNVNSIGNLGNCFYYGSGCPQDYAKAVEYLKKAEKLGNNSPNILYLLGMCYDNGYGIARDYAKAFEYFSKSAESDHPNAQFELANYYYNGKWITKNHTKAFELYIKSAESGNPYAQYNVGYCYDNGDGVTADSKKAVEWYRKSAEQGHADAQYKLASLIGDSQNAFEWYKKAAHQDHADAQYEVGECYQSGSGVTKDLKKAIEWYSKSAEQGNADASYKLGYFYQFGEGVEQDYAKAVGWYTKAYEYGYNISYTDLADCYYELEDYKKAFQYYMKEVEDDCDENGYSQFRVAECYEYGRGVSEDKAKAFDLYKKISDSPFDDWIGDQADLKLANCYHHGIGVQQDLAKAFEIYNELAKDFTDNDSGQEAQETLGDFYFNGIHVKKDYNEALKWYQKSQSFTRIEPSDSICIKIANCYYNMNF